MAPAISLTPRGFASAFPFHFVVDRELRVVQTGQAIAKSCPGLRPGASWTDAIELIKPSVSELSFNTLKQHPSSVFLLRLKGSGLRLRGQVLVEGDPERAIFLGVPWITDLAQLRNFQLEISDYPLHDASADFLFMIRSAEMARNDAKRMASKLEAQSEDLRAAKLAAEKASRAKSRFLATMSHEIRTPMNGVLGMAEMLLSEDLGEQSREYAQVISSSASALMVLIDDILDFSKIEAGMLDIIEETFDPDRLAREVVDLFAQQAKARGVELKLDVSIEVPEQVIADANRIRQVIVNLIGNALKFTAVGEVSVRIGSVPGESPRLRFEVEDTGIGIPESEREQVFQPFVQVDASLARRFGGSGLGLAISKRLIQLMHGEIGLHSREGAGSTFWFEVPVGVPGARVEFETVKAPMPMPIFPCQVLVAEDNAVNQHVARKMLSRLGCRVDVVSDGAAAVSAVESGKYDLVFMDMQMPVMDGLEATRRIRSLGSERSDTLIIAMTANALPEDREACALAGMNDYVAKPISIDAVAGALQRALSVGDQ